MAPHLLDRQRHCDQTIHWLSTSCAKRPDDLAPAVIERYHASAPICTALHVLD
jgi:hypothetical protein